MQSDALAEAESRIRQARDEGDHSLDLSDLGLETIPESIAQLSALEVLVLSGNALTRIPPAVRHLSRLSSLYLSQNPLDALPSWIGELAELRTLSLWGTGLVRLPKEIGRLAHLQDLDLSRNNLVALPPSIGLLSRLVLLDVSANRLQSLPDSIGGLVSLQNLNLMGNELTTLPGSIGRLRKLGSLDLMDNALTSLPESIGNLSGLVRLDLAENDLEQLPESIRQLTALGELQLHENTRLDLPEEVLGPSWNTIKPGENWAKPEEILDYYFRTRGGKRPLNEAKLILVGRGKVGKTSLVNRLVHGRFDLGEEKTEGIQITEWQLRLNENEDVRLNIWDFGGQEIMHATHQFFLTQRSLYLLVLNGREGGEDADAEYWLKLIDSFGGDSPVIVVLNKIKEHPFDLNRRALQQKYPIRDFIQTDCANGIGIEELRRAIERETDRLENLRDAFPASWFTIKEQLSGMDRNYLSFDEYRQFCQEHGEMDSEAQELLAVYLHRLGVVLNYCDDPRLQDTHILNPHWVTTGIYKVLNSEILAQQKGEIRLEDLAKILDASEYPAAMRRFIFDLMKKFNLCFSFPDDDTRYLVPELLDKQEPEEAEEFPPEECLNFQYHYPVLPEGLLPRFIVRTHVLSEGLPRWRTGVILRFEGNRALVKADVQDRKVFIRVAGPAAGQRRLLAVIRSDFERIHRDIRNLQPQEMIPLPGSPEEVVSYEALLAYEQAGLDTVPHAVGRSVWTLSVRGLLNGVDLEGTRPRRSKPDERTRPVRLFYSYSHRDETLRNELETHLKLLQRVGMIESWHDRNIDAGDDWKRRIDENLERADIVLLLISSDFLASDYCYEKEMLRALERHEGGDARVIPVIVRDVNWSLAPFAKLQALPKDALAVMRWPDRDTAWRNVSEGIERVVAQLRK